MISDADTSRKPAAARPFAHLVRAALAIATLALVGCSHYQLGMPAPPGFASLYIEPVRVDALIPQAQVVLSSRMRDAFIRDPRVRVVATPEEADAVLRVTVHDYERAVATVRADDTGLARRFDVGLKASATLFDRRSKRDIFTDRSIDVQRGVFTDSGQIQAEYQNLPVLADELAKRTLHAVLDTW
jgi:outer membrane lipopolysaccharide assembly protein LptE/RlpB